MYSRLAPPFLCMISFMLPLFALAASVERVDTQGIAPDVHNKKPLALEELHLQAKGEPIALADNRSLQRMIQTYRGIPIYGHGVTVERDAHGQVIHASGRYLQGLEENLPRVEPALNPDQAVQALQMQWHIKRGDTWETVKNPRTELFIYQPRQDTRARLVYLASYDLVDKPGRPSTPTGLIDAMTAEVLNFGEGVATLETRPVYGRGGNVLMGEYHYGNERPTLPATQRGQSCSFNHDGIEVTLGTNPERETPWVFPCPFSVPDPVNGGYASVNDLYYHTVITRDLYLDILGIAPVTGRLKVRYSTIEVDGAGWLISEKVANFYSGSTGFYPLVSQDVVAHEISHGFTLEHSGMQDFDNQGGGIVEAFSDMAGEAAKYRRDRESDFIVMSAITKPDGDYGGLGGLRQMCHQSTDGKSIEHASQFDMNGMDPHYSSGVYNKAYCLLSKAQGWDQRQAFQLFALANHSYWRQEETFDTAACGAEEAARALGHSVADLQTALAAVGVHCAAQGNGS